MNRRVQLAEESINSKGYAVEDSYIRPIGTMTRIWGLYQSPTPFYIQISNLDTLSVIAGNHGIADINIGDDIFDQNFVIRTNDKDCAIKLLSNTIKTEIFKYKNFRFRTGSLDNLLSVEYFNKQKEGRNERTIWMIEVAGKLSNDEIEALLRLAKNLNSILNTISDNWTKERNIHTSFFEGR